jgi:hypothetical protein
MELLVALVVILVVAGAIFAVVQQRRPGGARTSARPRRGRRVPRRDPMTAAVVDHALVTDPADVPAAEARLRAQAQQVAVGLQADANREEHERAADELRR